MDPRILMQAMQAQQGQQTPQPQAGAGPQGQQGQPQQAMPNFTQMLVQHLIQMLQLPAPEPQPQAMPGVNMAPMPPHPFSQTPPMDLGAPRG